MANESQCQQCLHVIQDVKLSIEMLKKFSLTMHMNVKEKIDLLEQEVCALQEQIVLEQQRPEMRSSSNSRKGYPAKPSLFIPDISP